MSSFEGRTRCQVVVVGDPGTGKSSLITAVATDSFPEKTPAVLPPTRLPHDFYPDRVPLTIIDTSSRCLLIPISFEFFCGWKVVLGFCEGSEELEFGYLRGLGIILERWN